MSDFFGKWFDTRSKAQREADAKAYQQKVLPYGAAQREKLAALFARIHSVKQKDLLMYQFLVIKEQVLGSGGSGAGTIAEQAVAYLADDNSELAAEIMHHLTQTKDPYIRRMSPEDKAFFVKIMLVDLAIDEALDYEAAL